MMIPTVMPKKWVEFSRAALIAMSVLTMPSIATADALRIAVPSDPGYLDPAYWGSSVEQLLIDNLYPRLGKYAPGDTWVVELDAAKSVDLSDPQHIKFELKPGIMWSGGFGELTAEDVEYSYERHLDEDLESGAVTEFTLLEDVEVTGTYTGIIHLKEPSPSFWSATLVYTSGAIISKAAAEDGDGYFYSEPVATTGPYKFKSFEPGESFTLEKDPGWIGEPGDFDEIVLIPITEDSAAQVAFEANEIDYSYYGSALIYDLYKDNPPRGSVASLDPSIDPLWLGISETYEGLSDIRVRHAIQKAIDVPTILAATTNGYGKQASGITPEGLSGYRGDTKITRDVAAAKALIKEAGAEGTVIRLDYFNFAGRATAAQIIQANLAEIGLVVELNGQDEGSFWSIDPARVADLQMHLKAWTGNPDPIYTLQYFISDQVGIWNWEGYANPKYDAMVAKARGNLNDVERDALYIEMQDMLEASGNFLFVTHEPYVSLSREGMVPAALPDGRPVFGDFRKSAN